MNKANYLMMTALLLAGCGAPYVTEGSVYVGLPPLSSEHSAESWLPDAEGSAPARESGTGGGRPTKPEADTTKKVVHVTASATVVQLLPQRTQTLRGTVTYTDGTRDSNVEWSSSDQTIVTINPTTGEVTGVRPGTATIQARSGADLNRYLNIPVMVREGVEEDVVASVVAPRDSLTPGETVQLEARLTNSSSEAHLNGRWTSSNQQVAYVNDHGLVTARRPGQATISFASDQKATVAARVTLTVEAPEQ